MTKNLGSWVIVVFKSSFETLTSLVHTVCRGTPVGWALLGQMVQQHNVNPPEQQQPYLLWEFAVRSSPDSPAESTEQHLLHLPIFPYFFRRLLQWIPLSSWRQVWLWSKEWIWVSHPTSAQKCFWKLNQILNASILELVTTMHAISWVFLLFTLR